MAREILTLQLGNYANYVGTHFWNLQEASFCYDPNAEPGEVDHDVLYREGRTANRQTTYTPRVLLVDLKGTLKFMPREGELYGRKSGLEEDQLFEEVPWESGRVELVKEAKVEKNEFQKDLEVAAKNNEEEEEDKDYNFKETVQDWIDFSYSRFHPRSVNIVNQYVHSKEENQFDTITNGMQLWQDFGFQDEFADKIRQYLEECDGCQGFQTIMDCVDGFAGVGVKTLEHLQDEYGKASLVFPVIPPSIVNYKNADKTMSASVRVINTALAFANLIECCSMFVPLSTMSRCWRDVDKPRSWPHLAYEQTNHYQTAAILATFLDTGSLRYRLKNPASGGFLASLCSDITPYGRKMAAAGLALPFPMNSSEDLIDFLDKSDQKTLHTQLTPNTAVGTNYVVQSVSIRGIPGNKLKRPATAKSAQRQQRMAAYRCDSVSEMMQFYYQCQLHASISHVTACKAPMEVRTPFPYELFDSRVGHDGFLAEFDLGAKQVTSSTSTLATVQNSGNLADPLDSLHREVKPTRGRKKQSDSMDEEKNLKPGVKNPPRRPSRKKITEMEKELTEDDDEYEPREKGKRGPRRKKVRKSDPSVCDICGQTVAYFVKESHHNQHLGIRPYKCDYEGCGRTYFSRNDLRTHSKRHQISYHVCEICGRNIKGVEWFRRHVKTHTEGPQFTCEVCGSKFRRKAQLQTHMVTHTGLTPHECVICGKRFALKYNLESHVKRHQKKEELEPVNKEDKNKEEGHKESVPEKRTWKYYVKPDTSGKKHHVSCETCGQSVHKREMESHVNKHLGRRPYSCDVPGCTLAFYGLRGIKEHKMVVHSDKVIRYDCSICNRSIKGSGTFKRHVMLHNADMKVSCQHCGKKFTSKSYLKAHELKHTGERPFVCEVCGRSFAMKACWKMHMKTVHKPGKPPKKEPKRPPRKRKSAVKKEPPPEPTVTSVKQQQQVIVEQPVVPQASWTINIQAPEQYPQSQPQQQQRSQLQTTVPQQQQVIVQIVEAPSYTTVETVRTDHSY